MEYAIAADLEKRGIEFTYEKHTIPYYRNVKSGSCSDCGSRSVRKRATYKPDFFLPGVGLFVEAKGRLVASDRTKLQAVAPEFAKLGKGFAILFSADNFTTKLKRERYSGWATRVGLRFAVGQLIPPEWLL